MGDVQEKEQTTPPSILVQPKEEGGFIKINKPHLVYISLIIASHIVNNCVIYFRTNSSIMPKGNADMFGIKHELVPRKVLKLNGNTINIIGVIKNLKLYLHACLSYDVLQDIFVIDIPNNFSI